jgi:hypothetical protein
MADGKWQIAGDRARLSLGKKSPPRGKGHVRIGSAACGIRALGSLWGLAKITFTLWRGGVAVSALLRLTHRALAAMLVRRAAHLPPRRSRPIVNLILARPLYGPVASAENEPGYGWPIYAV